MSFMFLLSKSAFFPNPINLVNPVQNPPASMSTKPWRDLRYTQPQFEKQIAALNRHAEPAASRMAAVAEIIATVRKEGDDALVKYAKKWDGVDISRGSLLLPSRTPQLAPSVRAATEYTLKNVRTFSKL